LEHRHAHNSRIHPHFTVALRLLPAARLDGRVEDMQVFEDEIARRCGNFKTQALTNMLVRPTPELNEAACGASSHQARGDVVISGNGVMQPVVFSSWRVTWVCDAVCGLTVSTIAKTGGFCMRLKFDMHTA